MPVLSEETFQRSIGDFWNGFRAIQNEISELRSGQRTVKSAIDKLAEDNRALHLKVDKLSIAAKMSELAADMGSLTLEVGALSYHQSEQQRILQKLAEKLIFEPGNQTDDYVSLIQTCLVTVNTLSEQLSKLFQKVEAGDESNTGPATEGDPDDEPGKDGGDNTAQKDNQDGDGNKGRSTGKDTSEDSQQNEPKNDKEGQTEQQGPADSLTTTNPTTANTTQLPPPTGLPLDPWLDAAGKRPRSNENSSEVEDDELDISQTPTKSNLKKQKKASKKRMEEIQYGHVTAKEEPIIKVTTLPKFDLEGYVSNYTGRTRTDRLVFIAERCEHLALEAFTLAIKLLKEGQDVTKYRKTVEKLAAKYPDAPEAKLDEEWINVTSKEISSTLERLEGQLKSYKANMIKESIRMGQEDLANFYYQIGDLQSAYRSYTRMREFCTQPSHVHDMSLQIIKTCLNPDYNNYTAMLAVISRTRNISRNDGDDPKVVQKLTIASALGDLHNKAYHSAAARFLRQVEATFQGVFNDVVSHSDIAVYGGLCALATMDRDHLKTEVIENSGFRAFLDLEPHILRAINAFVQAKYSVCLQILEDYKTDYLLDVFLSRHVETLYKMIRHKSIVNYFIPYSTVKFRDMATAFNTPVNVLIDELEVMIKEKTLNAKLDMETESLVAKSVDNRQELYSRAIANTKEYSQTARLHLLHMEFASKGYNTEKVRGSVFNGGPGDNGRSRGNRHQENIGDRW